MCTYKDMYLQNRIQKTNLNKAKLLQNNEANIRTSITYLAHAQYDVFYTHKNCIKMYTYIV